MVTTPERNLSQRRTLIDVTNLTKTYRTPRSGDVHALKDVSFSIAEGEFISVVGPSGCGKSTLLKILAGLLPYKSGTVRLAGNAVKGPNRQVGVVFQSPVLLPWRTVMENVMLPLEVLGLKGREFRDRAINLLQMVGLQGFESRYPFELSGGMQQRAAIVRSLVHDPQMLLMDEPFGALDAMTREQMNLEVLRIWQASQKTVLFITHSINEAIFLSDRVFVMTPRPGELAEIIPIDLPRPRNLDMINSDQFGAYSRRIRKLLQAQGDLS